MKSGRSLVAVRRSKPGTRNSAFELRVESVVSRLAEEMGAIWLRPSAKDGCVRCRPAATAEAESAQRLKTDRRFPNVPQNSKGKKCVMETDIWPNRSL